MKYKIYNSFNVEFKTHLKIKYAKWPQFIMTRKQSFYRIFIIGGMLLPFFQFRTKITSSGNRTSAQELRHKFRKISLTSAHVIFLHGAEINIPIELGAEVNIGCRSPQVGAEVKLCRSYSCRTSIAPVARSDSHARIIVTQ